MTGTFSDWELSFISVSFEFLFPSEIAEHPLTLLRT